MQISMWTRKATPTRTNNNVTRRRGRPDKQAGDVACYEQVNLAAFMDGK
jgi:hypothetical protein